MYPVLRSCFFFFFFFNDTATTEIYTLSLHDALPIFLDVDLDHLPGNFRGDRGPPPRDDVARGIEHRGLRAGSTGGHGRHLYLDRTLLRQPSVTGKPGNGEQEDQPRPDDPPPCSPPLRLALDAHRVEV